MEPDSDESREYEVDRSLESQVKDAITSYVRLRFQLKRSGWWIFAGETIFTVVGPSSVLDRLTSDIEKIAYQGWLDQQW
jgi:hypothetical protein